ncbi:MAG: tyrosine-protein phosphatase [Bacteroidales bacterium]|nr:tyrosine-protein phosphatase [Bacteroidales bacterium]MBR6903290.1 tyrosine-protein phosphatase [Bacteroidales bacterium]
MKRILSFSALLLLLVSCSGELEPVAEPQPQARKAGDFVFYASFGDVSVPETKVFMNDSWQLRWNADDQISIFNKTADNLQFAFAGAEADATGQFSSVNGNATLSGSAVPHIYAVYPYGAETSVAADGTISLTLPAEQTYYGGVSFGRGANTMVSVTDNESAPLVFKNVCGYLQLKLYGDDVAISRVTFKGNNDELLAGAATVTAAVGEAPTVTMGTGATKEVSIVCADPVKLGADADHYTTFLLAIPPTTFTKGFTITVTDADGYVIEKSTSNSYTIGRNEIFPMAPIKCRTIETFQIENEKVQDYMSSTDYYSSDISYSSSYFDNHSRSDSDDPLPFTMTVSGAATVQMKSLSELYPREWTVSVSNSIKIYNLIPGVVYHYDVQNASGASLKSGFVRPKGQVRMINGVVYNFRDLGGWKADGGSIVYGKLYRGAELNNLSSSGKNIFFNDLKISVDLDLRGYDGSGTPGEIQAPSGCEYEYENIKLWKFLGKGTGTTQELYQKAIRDIIGWLSHGKNVYFHCVGGADRTGTLAFLIEALVGVSEADLSKDYELTSFDGVSNHSRKRNDTVQTNPNYIYTWLINYLRQDQFGGTSVSINQNVENWAKTRHSQAVAPLTDEEIATLRRLLVVTD